MDSLRHILYIFNFFIDKLQFCNIFKHVERYRYYNNYDSVFILNFQQYVSWVCCILDVSSFSLNNLVSIQSGLNP
ncbi:hypothetical protein ES703_72137 [subsurface metagenome]